MIKFPQILHMFSLNIPLLARAAFMARQMQPGARRAPDADAAPPRRCAATGSQLARRR